MIFKNKMQNLYTSQYKQCVVILIHCAGITVSKVQVDDILAMPIEEILKEENVVQSTY
jgi:hypothetical protein